MEPLLAFARRMPSACPSAAGDQILWQDELFAGKCVSTIKPEIRSQIRLFSLFWRICSKKSALEAVTTIACIPNQLPSQFGL
jgi:hypothetical protein